MLAGKGKRRRALPGGDRRIPISFENIPQELHVELVVFDDQDPFRRDGRGLITLHINGYSRICAMKGRAGMRRAVIGRPAWGAAFVKKLLKCRRSRREPV